MGVMCSSAIVGLGLMGMMITPAMAGMGEMEMAMEFGLMPRASSTASGANLQVCLIEVRRNARERKLMMNRVDIHRRPRRRHC